MASVSFLFEDPFISRIHLPFKLRFVKEYLKSYIENKGVYPLFVSNGERGGDSLNKHEYRNLKSETNPNDKKYNDQNVLKIRILVIRYCPSTSFPPWRVEPFRASIFEFWVLPAFRLKIHLRSADAPRTDSRPQKLLPKTADLLQSASGFVRIRVKNYTYIGRCEYF